jgi:hypothetical protein
MALRIHQKSIYLILFNATMISRSVGKTLKATGRAEVRCFKIRVFQEVESLIAEMDAGTLAESAIVASIEALSNEFGISVGQAQKAINVILKYHFYLTRPDDQSMRQVLHCPIDSIVQKRLRKRVIPLTRIGMSEYVALQNQIQSRSTCRLDFDTVWDEEHLRDEGIL